MATDTIPDVSLCLIVRNEAALLPRFIDSVRGAWDEFIAVDTGSTDDTVRLLENAGAHVIHQAWADDFALARNTGLQAAHGRWILILDADEFPEPAFAGEMRRLLARPDFGAATIHRFDQQKNGIVRHSHPIRLFANDPDIRYRCRIHEDARDGIDAWLARHARGYFALDTPVQHVGYALERYDARDKATRDARILALAIADDAADLYSRYKLLELYRFTGQTTAAQALARETLGPLDACHAIAPRHVAGDLVDLVCQALCGEDATGALAFMARYRSLAEHTPHFHLAIGMRHEQLGALEPAFHAFARVLELTPGHPAALLMETRALAALTRIAIAAGDLAAARDFNAAARERAPDDPEVMLAARVLAP